MYMYMYMFLYIIMHMPCVCVDVLGGDGPGHLFRNTFVVSKRERIPKFKERKYSSIKPTTKP